MQFKITLLTLTLFASISTALFANKYKIEIEAPNYKNQSAELYRYVNSKAELVDSLSLNNVGYVCFQDTLKEITGGEYLLKIDDSSFALLIDNNDSPIEISMKIDPLEKKSTIKGSKDTKLLWSYINEITPVMGEITATQKELGSVPDDLKKGVTDHLLLLIDKSRDITARFIKENKGSWFANFLSAYTPTDVSSYINAGMTREEMQWAYQSHFFDNVNFEEEKLLNTSFFSAMIDDFLNQIVVQSPDSLVNATSRIVQKAEGNPKAFNAILHYLFDRSFNSYVVGDENIWMKLFEDYIKDKDNITWLTPYQYYQYDHEYESGKRNRIGMRAENLNVKQIDGSFININDIAARYTILLFYSSTCGHCDIAIHDLHQFLEENKDSDIKVVAFIVNGDEESWREFVDKHKMESWINVADFDFKSEYWTKYDARATPMIYLLNSDKQIISRRINVNGLKKLFNHYK